MLVTTFDIKNVTNNLKTQERDASCDEVCVGN